jgi:hypothetical protein
MNELQTLNGQEAAVPTLIGEAPTRFAIGGKIRAGIKVLTAAAAREREAQAIFEAGVETGKSLDDIAAEITRAVPELRHPLVRKNVAYFSVRRGDFAMAELADQILAKFGEDRGDGVARLYRFPVVFPADAWQVIMPHALMCYGESTQVLVRIFARRSRAPLHDLRAGARRRHRQASDPDLRRDRSCHDLPLTRWSY